MLRADCAMPCCVPTAPCHAACRLCYSRVSAGGAASPTGHLAIAGVSASSGSVCTTCSSGNPMPGVSRDVDYNEIINGVCITSDSAVAAPDGTKIAGQCCEADGTCKRRTSGSNADCIAGIGNGDASFVEMTFAQTLAACSSRGLVLCEKTCKGEGCQYDYGYVWTGLACDGTPLAPTPAGEPKMSTLTSLDSFLAPSVVLFSLCVTFASYHITHTITTLLF